MTSPSRETFAETRERFLARAVALVEQAKISTAPIDPRRLAQLCGIHRIVVTPGLDVAGRLVSLGDGLEMHINGSEPLARQHFTACHEIAHTFSFRDGFPRHGTVAERVDCSSHQREEALCDLAASELLMPQKLFSRATQKLAPSLESVRTLAKLFQASLSATILRIGRTRSWPVTFIVWRFMPRPGSTWKLRVLWSVKPDGERCYIPKFAPAALQSGTYATFISAIPTSETEVLKLGNLHGKFFVENARFGGYVVSMIHDPKFNRRTQNAG